MTKKQAEVIDKTAFQGYENTGKVARKSQDDDSDDSAVVLQAQSTKKADAKATSMVIDKKQAAVIDKTEGADSMGFAEEMIEKSSPGTSTTTPMYVEVAVALGSFFLIGVAFVGLRMPIGSEDGSEVYVQIA